MAREIVLIGAVGRAGELGLNGGLPWGDAFPEDRIRFRDVTTNGIVIFGYKTWLGLVHLDGTYNRIIKYDTYVDSVPYIIYGLWSCWPDRTIFIAGGAKTYQRWLRYVTRFDITVLPWTGPADVYMPPLFGPPSKTPMGSKG